MCPPGGWAHWQSSKNSVLNWSESGIKRRFAMPGRLILRNALVVTTLRVVGKPFRYAPERPTTGKVRLARDSGVGSPSHLSEMATIRPCGMRSSSVTDLAIWRPLSES
jgi:hypothetical protein